MSLRRSYRLIGLPMDFSYYLTQARDTNVLQQRMRDLATARPRVGYERLDFLLTREDWMVGRNKVRRLHKLERLQVRVTARRKKRISLHRGPTPSALAAGRYWAMDFVHDKLTNGRKFRVLTTIDTQHWQCVAPQSNCSLPAQSVVDRSNEVARDRAQSFVNIVNHGTELPS